MLCSKASLYFSWIVAYVIFDEGVGVGVGVGSLDSSSPSMLVSSMLESQLTDCTSCFKNWLIFWSASTTPPDPVYNVGSTTNLNGSSDCVLC